jgi:hypothetical protein
MKGEASLTCCSKGRKAMFPCLWLLYTVLTALRPSSLALGDQLGPWTCILARSTMGTVQICLCSGGRAISGMLAALGPVDLAPPDY